MEAAGLERAATVVLTLGTEAAARADATRDGPFSVSTPGGRAHPLACHTSRMRHLLKVITIDDSEDEEHEVPPSSPPQKNHGAPQPLPHQNQLPPGPCRHDMMSSHLEPAHPERQMSGGWQEPRGEAVAPGQLGIERPLGTGSSGQLLGRPVDDPAPKEVVLTTRDGRSEFARREIFDPWVSLGQTVKFGVRGEVLVSESDSGSSGGGDNRGERGTLEECKDGGADTTGLAARCMTPHDHTASHAAVDSATPHGLGTTLFPSAGAEARAVVAGAAAGGPTPPHLTSRQGSDGGDGISRGLVMSSWRGLLRSASSLYPMGPDEGLMDISNSTGDQQRGVMGTVTVSPSVKGDPLLPTPPLIGADSDRSPYPQNQQQL